MKWYQHTKQAQLRIVMDAYVRPDVLTDHYEHDDIENECYRCPQCGKDEFVVTYHPQWPKAGCRSNDCELKPYMNVLELIECFWSDNEVETLPEETRARKQALRRRLEGLCDATYESEETSREEQLDSLQRRVSSLEAERDEWERVAETLRSENDALQLEYASVSAKLQRRVDREARDAGTITSIVASLFVALWAGAFAASAARAELSGGWILAMLLVSLAYGVAVGYAFYREMVRHRREPYNRRVDFECLLRWTEKAVFCFAGSYVLVRAVTGLGRWRLTDRDLDILEFLARYRLGTAEQVRREFFGDSLNGAYRRLKALEEMKLVRGERVFYRGPGVFRVTEPGARLADVDLPPPRRDRERIYHALEVIELSWALRNDEYEEVEEWITERELRRDRMIARREQQTGRMRPGGPLGRTPDGLMILSEGSEVAVELELSPKRKASYRRIFEHYERQFEKREVDGVRIYFSSRRAMERVQTIAGHHHLRGRVEFYHYEPVLESRR